MNKWAFHPTWILGTVLLMLAPPTVSVVMPVYNGERYLADAVRSICQQTFEDFEFIIVNDGSTDGTLAMLQGFAERDERICVLDQPNSGVVGASNAGLALAQGDLLARMDADDIAMPERLAKQVAYMQAHPECVGLGTAVRMIDADGDPVRTYPVPLRHEDIDSAMFRTWAIFHPTLMARREVVIQLGGYREQFATLEDSDLFMRLAERGKLANLPEPLVHYRVHLRSLSVTSVKRMNEIVGELQRQTRARRGEPIHVPGEPEPSCGPDVLDPAFMQMMWGWWAHDDGHYATARKHAVRLLRRRPWDIERWRLLACALRGLWRQGQQDSQTTATEPAIQAAGERVPG